MEVNIQRRKAGLDEKIPDIQKTLETVNHLKVRNFGVVNVPGPLIETYIIQSNPHHVEATFELNDTIYAKALVPPTREVYLWLGANVMLSYSVVEAEILLKGKLSSALQTLDNCEEDLDFLREQITVSRP